ncbi:serine hydrolase [Marivirga sp. S37H4]|uniref:Serine hydrolase n=1 Tax=Marivirga aurantiaca TaxID=2802615 RepID=A0A935C5I9_9BACT|nr:serine hydrolase [Marivirga aurantiaca]MBK6263830.1 serine hydrolase [Marivirga aurantiaca]
MKHGIIIISFILSLSMISYGQNVYRYSQPQNLEDGWNTNSLKSQNVDSTRIYQLFNQLQNGEHKIHSILLVKTNQILIEEYFGENAINKQHDLRSATKSITSLLMGIAIDKGFIDNIDDPVIKYVKHPIAKKNPDKRKDKITIRHLLTMSSGLDCNDWDKKSKGQEDRVYKKNDWLQYFWDLPLINEPGTVSNYCTMGQILATEIISQASGMTIDKFAEQYLFNPLAINNVSWGHTSNKEVIPSAKRLYMTSRDMAKIGQLILNKGKWNKQQIVSQEWIEESTSAKTAITGMDYGFLWWNVPLEVNQKTIISKAATGNGGQYILVFPEADMVAVFTGGAYNSQEDKLPFVIMKEVFLPTFMTEN